MCQCRTCNKLQPCTIGEYILQDAGKSIDVAAGKDELRCNRSDEIVRCADTIAHCDGTPTTHSFIDYHCERFVLRGQHHKISRGIDSRESGLIDEAKKAGARGNTKRCSLGFKLRPKRTFAGEKKEGVLNICLCEGSKKISGPLPGLQFGAEENYSVAR